MRTEIATTARGRPFDQERTSPPKEGAPYVLGHSAHELERLARQAAFLGELTEDMLRRAGVEPGMRVLDAGCGAGDVSLMAARMVGPRGAVLGIDSAVEPLDMARRRAEAEGVHWLGFEQADLATLEPDLWPSFDAVVGRMVLVYASDPTATLRTLLRQLRPGGVVAFQEMDFGRCGAVPETPLLRRCLEWAHALYERAGLTPDMGGRLYGAFRRAGLAPSLIGACKVEGGAEGFGYAWLAQTMRSLLPAMTQFGIATAEEVSIETLEERLRRDAQESGACLICPLMVSAWARAPGTAATEARLRLPAAGQGASARIRGG